MKTLKLKSNSNTFSRETISKIGETIYHSPDVQSVAIQVEFNDGSGIRFRRTEIKDEIDRQINDFGEDE